MRKIEVSWDFVEPRCRRLEENFYAALCKLRRGEIPDDETRWGEIEEQGGVCEQED